MSNFASQSLSSVSRPAVLTSDGLRINDARGYKANPVLAEDRSATPGTRPPLDEVFFGKLLPRR